MLDMVDWAKVNSFLDPCAGDDRIAREALNRKPSLGVDSCEIRQGSDYFKELYGPNAFDLVMTNPPFSIAQGIITKALMDGTTVVMLQRLNFLGAQKRREWWWENEPSHLFVLSERPCFIHVCVGGRTHGVYSGCGASYHADAGVLQCTICGGRVRPGSDATEYAWFGWGDAFTVSAGVHHL
jgi:hypothetical protein